jgi:hypothetical protein
MLIYLASPYSHEDATVREARYRQACEFNGKCFEKGLTVFSPIVSSHVLAVDYVKDPKALGFDFWRRYDLAVLRHCGAIWVLQIDGWQASKGIAAELEAAKAVDIPGYYVTPDSDPMETFEAMCSEDVCSL